MTIAVIQPGWQWMTKQQRDRCAGMVEQIRGLARSRTLPLETDPHVRDTIDQLNEAIGELCDQLVMILQPIRPVLPK